MSWLPTLLRTLALTVIGVVISALADLGLSTGGFLVAAGAGTLIGQLLLRERVRLSIVLLSTVVIGGLWHTLADLFLRGVDLIFGDALAVSSFVLEQGALLTFFVYVVVSTVAHGRLAGFFLAELGIFTFGLLAIFAPHQNLRLDRPVFVADLAWQFGVAPLTMLAAVGSVALLILTVLGLTGAKSFDGGSPQIAPGGSRLRRSLLGTISVIVVLGVAAYLPYRFFQQELLKHPPQGVGQGDGSEGVSPLDFSGGGVGNNQPSALVRLEGDYSDNPYSPVLYLREAALSHFTGRELVTARVGIDGDVPRVRPGEPFSRDADPLLANRRGVSASVYLLADHNLAFGVPDTLILRRLANPKPDRFRIAYRADSFVPSFSLQSLLELPVGNPGWSEEEQRHYLTPHPDPRYEALARRIVGVEGRPVGRAALITQYLTNNSIYTLTPNHQVEKDGDPTAAYLFGDMRGYCVHFAHATVYLLRALGIPTRIGTGYMTDLTESRDGHILLRMSDRHAWAEVYVTGRGWLPFDTTPDQVENHADSDVDAKLLEELMSMLSPDSEVLPDVDLPTPPDTSNPVTGLRSLGIIVGSLLGVMLAATILLRALLAVGWRFATTPRGRARWAYRALEAAVAGLAFQRSFGETKIAFASRVAQERATVLGPITEIVNRTEYSNEPVTSAEIDAAHAAGVTALRSLGWRRWLTWINPATVAPLLRRVFLVALLVGATFTVTSPTFAQEFDPFDTERWQEEITTSEEEDIGKSAEQLLSEAELLLIDQRPLDARTKLLRALERAPNDFRPHLMLAEYYLVHVGHFRLAKRYVERAKTLFFEQHGEPPYSELRQRQMHAALLNLLSQATLDLDDYAGALAILDQYQSWGYFSPWYPASRAWILMKLGQLDEAVRVARAAAFARVDPGRTLNMLGILLSVRNERSQSIQVFEQAIQYEFDQGRSGNPATPLNNIGEVYRELFLDEKAESSWLRALSLPDGCEHVLPSLNLSLLYVDHGDIRAAARTMTRFESCVAQYALRNGEEHRALVHLMRARIDLLAGRLSDALAHLEEAEQKRQWFGKIGTSVTDFRVGIFLTMGQALRRKAARDSLTVRESLVDRIASSAQRTKDELRAWWYLRRAMRTLSDELGGLEDISIRNTDSLIEYATFGEALAVLPPFVARRRIEQEWQRDDRVLARRHYDAYRAEVYLADSDYERGLRLIAETIQGIRPREEELLRIHLLLLRLRLLDRGSEEYRSIANDVYGRNRALLRNAGLPLPVATEGVSESNRALMERSALYPSSDGGNEYVVRSTEGSLGTIQLTFASRRNPGGLVTVEAPTFLQALNELSDRVTTEQFENGRRSPAPQPSITQ